MAIDTVLFRNLGLSAVTVTDLINPVTSSSLVIAAGVKQNLTSVPPTGLGIALSALYRSENLRELTDPADGSPSSVQLIYTQTSSPTEITIAEDDARVFLRTLIVPPDMLTGQYSGNGLSKVLTFPWTPRVLEILDTTTAARCLKTADMLSDGFMEIMGGSTTYQVTGNGVTLGIGKVTIGSQASINSINHDYVWIAWR